MGRVAVPELFGHLSRDVRRRHQRMQRSEEHTSELQSLAYLVCRLLLEKKKMRVTIPLLLRFLGRFCLARNVEGDRFANLPLEGGLVNFFSFVDVDRAPCVSVETRHV